MAHAADLFSKVRNAAVHEPKGPSDDEIIRAIDAGLNIYRALAAVPRERNFVKVTNVPLFSDLELVSPVSEGTGLMLCTVAASPREERTERIYPTTRTYFEPGDEVAWGWSDQQQWGPAWYRHPISGEVVKAWDGSLEFIGPPLRRL